jgi:hypothetical protein
LAEISLRNKKQAQTKTNKRACKPSQGREARLTNFVKRKEEEEELRLLYNNKTGEKGAN